MCYNCKIMDKKFNTSFDNSAEYYDWASQSKVNQPFHYVVSRALFGVMAVKNGNFVSEIPESVKQIKGPAVIASTHRSWLDIPYFVQATERADLRYARPVAKDSLFKSKFLALVFHKLGAVAVDRKQPNFEGINKSFGAFLDAGNSINAFTEGTRVKSDTRTVLQPKKTAFHLALRHEVPIVPLAIAGVAVDDKRSPLWFGKPIVAVMGNPIYLPTLIEGDDRTVQKFIFSQTREHLIELHIAQQTCLDEAYNIRDNY